MRSARRGLAATSVLVVLLGAFAVMAWRSNGFGLLNTASGSVAAIFERTPAYPGYTWTRDGRQVSEFELNTIAGPAHCGWQAATMLNLGWPPGTVASSGSQSRQYLRDPKGVLPDRKYRTLLILDVLLPADARPTGHRLGAIELYLSPSDYDGIYLVGPSRAERWPQSDPMTACL